MATQAPQPRDIPEKYTAVTLLQKNDIFCSNYNAILPKSSYSKSTPHHIAMR
jgi:hypothetical protein